MGCGSSKPANVAAAWAKNLDNQGPVPELEWYYRPIWSQYINYIYESAKQNGGTNMLRRNFGEFLNNTAQEWLAVEYPECAKAGTTEAFPDEAMPLGNESGPGVPTKMFMTLDEGLNGITYAATLVVHNQMAWKSVSDGANSALPGSIMDAPPTKLAQKYMSFLVHGMEQQQVEVKHCVLNLIIGSVLMTARYKPHNLMPSASLISENANAEVPAPKEIMNKESPAGLADPQRVFRSRLFMSVLKTLESNYPGCTIWDAGKMSLKVDDKPYPYPARFLVCRDFEKRNKDVETVDFKVKCPDSEGNETVATILRARDPSEDPGGIVCLAIVVNVDPEDPWPKRDMDKHVPIMGAAFGEASMHGLRMSFMKGFDRCALRIWAGQDTRHYTFIAPHVKGQTAEDLQQFSDLLFGKEFDPLKPAPNPEDASDLEETFGVELRKQQEHRHWQSESHFQKMRQEMRERAQANPERYEMINVLAGHQSAATFMENNFGDCTITEEGELPQPDLKGAAKLENSQVLVARDPRQEPSSITAVLVSIPCPVPGYSPLIHKDKTWLQSPERKTAEVALMAVLKQWFSQGKISKVDCFAQIMIGMDAVIYQFVDGDKFIDYPEERMEQIKWQ
ncbi:hypothetical protein LLEC1_06072 [Akanthomyces lecanii]|uniref:Uncharacterized protein n=1 Tax=Cordyceps confragosa TaxID=2714763 RepID=A0A179IK24_CORDF|nr:hypothetical protein LLEC1_06072 [Akanthomyces lecanii]